MLVRCACSVSLSLIPRGRLPLIGGRSGLWKGHFTSLTLGWRMGRMLWDLSETKSELEELHRQRARGCCLWAGMQWAEEGKASTTYFFNLERKRGQEHPLYAIRTLGGLVVHSVSLIARACGSLSMCCCLRPSLWWWGSRTFFCPGLLDACLQLSALCVRESSFWRNAKPPLMVWPVGSLLVWMVTTFLAVAR